MKRNEIFQNWVFHYNPHENLWTAIPRESYQHYWNDRNIKGVIKSKDIKVLIEIIDKDKVNKYV